MKTAEEILIEFGCPDVTFDENVTMYYPAILSAMEEFANARVDEAMRWRDFDKELPCDGQHILRKIEPKDESDTFWSRRPYYADIFYLDHVNFDSKEYKKARERFRYLWRPIE